LERMADLAVDVAKATIRLKGGAMPAPAASIPLMAKKIDHMLQNALQSYVEKDADKAHSLAPLDDEVDKLYRLMVEGLFSWSAEHPESVSQAMTCAFVGRYLERIGDHATNIGEGVIYIVSAEYRDLN
jgi:phosphate transport system protein